jgi:hypothetical protein
MLSSIKSRPQIQRLQENKQEVSSETFWSAMGALHGTPQEVARTVFCSSASATMKALGRNQ